MVERLPVEATVSSEKPSKKVAPASSSKVGFEDVILYISGACPSIEALLRGLFIDPTGGEDDDDDDDVSRRADSNKEAARLSAVLLNKPTGQHSSNSLLDDCGSSQNSNNTSLTDILNEGNSVHSNGGAPPRAPGRPLSGAGLDSSGTFAVPTSIPRRGSNSLLSSSSPRARVSSRTGVGVKRISVIAPVSSAQPQSHAALHAPAAKDRPAGTTKAKLARSTHAVPADIFNAAASKGKQLKRSFSSTSQSLLLEPLSSLTANGAKKPKRALSLSADFTMSQQQGQGSDGLRPNALNGDMDDDPFVGLRAGTPTGGAAVRIKETPVRARHPPMVPPSRSFVGDTPVK